jgi:hypothetical protein
MGEISRRGNVVPVQARRASGGPPVQPTVVEVPNGTPSVPPSAGPSSYTQNVVYVVAPPPAAAPVPPPQEVHHHHHHHTTQVILPPRRRPRSRGTSFLGTLGFVIGGLACTVAFLPQVANATPYLAKAGLALAGLAWVGAVLLRRVGTTMPFVGMAVSAAAYGLWLYNTGQAQSAYDRLRSKSPVDLPAVRIPPPAAAPPAPTATPAVPMGQPPAATKKHDPSIFDMDSPGWTKPADGH